MCVCPTPHTRATQQGLLKNRAQPGDVGLRMRSTSLIILVHTPCLGISMILSRMFLNPSVSSKHVAETESPKYHDLRGVQEFFCLVF